MEKIQQTARAVTSKPVQRAVVTTALAVTGALSLLCTAAIATALFFQNYVPDQVLTSPVHLQYGTGLNPYGVASLTNPAMKSAQEYDISVTLSMPRSPPNLDRGNFMITIYLLDSPATPSLLVDAAKFASSSSSAPSPDDGTPDASSSSFFDWTAADFGLTRSVLFHSRRPALVPFVDPVISLASRLLFVFWHLLFPDNAQTCTLTVPLAEKVAFTRLTGAPRAAYVEVEGGQTIQIYAATLTLTAQLSGLRYLMFHYRLLTYLVFTFFFWVFEVFFMGAAFLVFSGSGNGTPTAETLRQKQIQLQRRRALTEEQQSDHAHTFPTYGKQPPLKHEPPDAIKHERDEEEEKERLMAELPVAGTEADDEDDEDEDVDKRDSGIGTSYSEDQGRHQSVRRRTSRSLRE